MDVKHSLIYPQTDLDAAPASPVGYPTVKTRRSAPCPGRSDNTVLLVSGPDALDGFRRVKNIGTCTLYIACYDQSRTFLNTGRATAS